MASEMYIPQGFGNCRLRFSCIGVPRVIGTSIGVEMGGETAADVANIVSDAFLSEVLQGGARLGNSWTYLGLTLTYGIGLVEHGLFEHNVSVVGTQGSPNPPPNVALLVQKRTQFTGRKWRGRMYCPAGMLFEPEITDAGTLITGALAGFTQDFADFLASVSFSGLALQLLHQFDPDTSSDPESPTTLTALIPQSLVATQRRRLR